MSLFSSLSFSLGGKSFLGGILNTASASHQMQDKETEGFVADLPSKNVSGSALKAKRKSKLHSSETTEKTATGTVHDSKVLSGSTTSSGIRITGVDAQAAIASDVPPLKKKNRNRNRRKNAKEVAVADEVAQESGESRRQQHKADGSSSMGLNNAVLDLPNKKKLYLSKLDPQWSNTEALVLSLVQRYTELQQSLHGTAEQVVNEQKVWQQLLGELKREVRSRLSHQGKQAIAFSNAEEDMVPLVGFTERGATEILGDSDISVDLDNEKHEDKTAENEADDDVVVSDRFDKHIPGIENAKRFRQFLLYLRDDLTELEEAYSEAVEKARESMKKEKAFEKYYDLRNRMNLDNDDINTSDILTTPYVLPNEALATMAPPINMSRKLSNLFTVVISPSQAAQDRFVNKQSQITLTGLSEDVKKCLQFLKGVDFSGKDNLTLDSRQIAALIGRNGSVIRKIQNESEVVIHVNNEVVTLYGLPKNREKARVSMEAIFKQIRERRVYEGIDIPKLAYQALSRFLSAEVRAIGDDTNTTINFLSKGEGGRAGIQGKSESDLMAAKKRLQVLVSSIAVVTVCEDAELISMFMQHKGSSNLRNGKSYFMQEVDGKLIIVGVRAAVEEAVPLIKKALKQLSYPIVLVSLHPAQLAVWKKKKQDFENVGVSISIATSRDRQQRTIELHGDPNSTENTKRLLLAFLEQEAVMETIDLSDSTTSMIRENKYLLKTVEEASGASCTLDKVESNVLCIGSLAAIAEAREQFIKLAAQSDTDAIPILKRQIPYLIGREGAVINSIRAESGISNLTLDEAKLVVKLRGTEDAVRRAKELVEEAVGKGSNGSAGGMPGKGSTEEKAKSNGAKLTVGTNDNSTKAVAPPSEIDFQNEALFPSLRESMVKQKAAYRLQGRSKNEHTTSSEYRTVADGALLVDTSGSNNSNEVMAGFSG